MAEYIDPNQFESIKLEIVFKNTTSKKEVKKRELVRIIELHENGLVVEVPAATAATGHSIVMHIQPLNTPEKMEKFMIGAKVDKLVVNEEGTERLELSLIQHHAEAWDKFREMFARRQEEIERFFESVRG